MRGIWATKNQAISIGFYWAIGIFLLLGQQSFAADSCELSFLSMEAEYLRDGRPRFDHSSEMVAFAEGHKLQAHQISTPTLVEGSQKQRIKRYWHTPTDGRFFYGLVLNEEEMEQGKESGKHPTDLYSLNMFKDFKRMYRYVDQIPNRDFQLSKEQILHSHSIVAQSLSIRKSRPGRIRTKRKYFEMKGEFSESQLNNILEKFEELKKVGLFQGLSSEEEDLFRIKVKRLKWIDGKAYGILEYPHPNVVNRALSDLISWTNTEMTRYRSSIDSTYDPIEIAAIFKNALFYIQPFQSENEKVARVFRDKILEVFNLQSERRLVLWNHLDSTLQQDILATRYSIYKMIEVLRSASTSEIYSVGSSNYGMEVPELKEEVLALSKQVPNNEEEIFRLGRTQEKEFIFKKDGFFYDHTGVAYTLLEPGEGEQTWRMVPLADASMYLYGLGGKIDVVEDASPFKKSKVRMRKMNPPHVFEFLKNYRFVEDLQRHKHLSQFVEIVDYSSTIAKYNDVGTPFLWDFQEDLLSWAVSIKEDPVKDPLAILGRARGNFFNPNSSGTTTFERSFVHGKTKFTWTEIIGQYQMLDLDLRKLAKYLKKERPDWYRRYAHVIDGSRKKLHTATRILLKDMIELFTDVFETKPKNQSNLSPQTYEFLKRHRRFSGMYEYYRYSMLWYEDFERAKRKVNQDRVLIARVTSSKRVDYMGFVPEESIGRFIKSVPGLEKLIRDIHEEIKSVKPGSDKEEVDPEVIKSRLVRRIANFIAKGKDPKENRLAAQMKFGLDQLISRQLVSIYKNRGLEREFERELVVMVLHAINRPPKMGLSTTVSPHLLFKTSSVPFSREIADPAIYIVEAPIDDVSRMRSGKFLSEYEVYLKNDIWFPISHFYIKRRFDPEELKPIKFMTEEKAKEDGFDLKSPWLFITEDGKEPQEVKDILNAMETDFNEE